MSFNPLDQKGLPFDKALRTNKQLNTQPYDKLEVDPSTLR